VGTDTALLGDETVLLVEDEAALRILTCRLLQVFGYRVLEAKNGTEALELSQSHHGAIHLLLTDVVMPGMSGRSLAQRLTEQRSEIKVVYMSGYTGQGVGHAVLDPGSIFLQKPFTRDSLARKIREGLSGGRAAATG